MILSALQYGADGSGKPRASGDDPVRQPSWSSPLT